MAINKELLKGCIEPLILAVLHDGDAYGYLLAREVAQKGGETFALKDGTLYPALKRLEQDGLVESYWGEGEGGRRRYYRLMEPGRAAHRLWLEEWKHFVQSMNSVLGVPS
ncbi:MAG TPA: helix-turn-helix transcriptional regulator [Symbiobacteriaceae bacterium]|jgi:PadR family transcriptional regulator PadR